MCDLFMKQGTGTASRTTAIESQRFSLRRGTRSLQVKWTALSRSPRSSDIFVRSFSFFGLMSK